MATSGSSASAAIPSLGYLVTEKLARNNHPLWKAQVQSALKGAQVAHFLNSAMEVPLEMIAKPDKMGEQMLNPDHRFLGSKGSTDTQLSVVLAFPGNSRSSSDAANICWFLGSNRRDVCIPTASARDQHTDSAGHCAEGKFLHC